MSAASELTQFKKGNRIWQQRTKVGRNRLFNDPQALWESACEYFEMCDSNPLIAVEFLGKNATRKEVPKMRPYTYSGLYTYLDCDGNTFNGVKENPDFLNIYTRICQIIYNQKFEGAASGFFNANIIARDLGLAEKSEVDNKNQVTINIVQLTAIAERLNNIPLIE